MTAPSVGRVPGQRGDSASVDLSVDLGRGLILRNPILVASGTFGYAREMEQLVDLAQLGGIVPKTITQLPRQGNAPWRTFETAAGMLNSIGLDNDGIESFIEHHMPYLRGLSRVEPSYFLAMLAAASPASSRWRRNASTVVAKPSGTRTPASSRSWFQNSRRSCASFAISAFARSSWWR